MSATPRVQLGGETLNSKWWGDVNTGTHASPVWAPIGGTVDFQPTYDATMQDDSDRDSGGAKSTVKTAYAWGITTKLARKVKADDATVYDPGQEAIRTAAIESGLNNVVEIRFYEMNVNDAGTVVGPKIEAWQGYAAVSWGEDGGAMDALDTVSVVLSGRGKRNAITHPEAAQAVPTITALSPTAGAAGGGTLIRIYGTGFFKSGVDDVVASTGIKLGGSSGTAFTTWTTVSDNLIVAVLPAKAAQTYAVVVYNSAGISTVTQSITTS